MTTVNPAADVPLPIGADPDNVDKWDTYNGVTSRLVWSNPHSSVFTDQTALLADIRIVASQLLDGSIIGEDDVTDCPLVYVDGSDYTLAQARVLAAALLNCVDLAERWVEHRHAEGTG